MDHREEIAHQYGFESFAELIDASMPLPRSPGDEVLSYLFHRPDGTWFVWEDKPRPAAES